MQAAGFSNKPDFFWTLHACFVSRPEQRILSCTLNSFAARAAMLTGPAVILLGLAPRHAVGLPRSINTQA